MPSKELTLFFAWCLLRIIEKRSRHNRQCRDYRNQHPERVVKSRQEWNARNAEYLKKRPKLRAEEHAAYCKDRYHRDPEYRLTVNYRTRINRALEANWKSGSTLELLGCSISQLREHLQKQFQPGMSWENKGVWHIDHIRPCVSFDLADPTQQKTCFHYTNLQPLWAIDNLIKGGR